MPTAEKNSVQIEIERLRISYREEAQFPVEKLSPSRRVQIREEHTDEKRWAPPDAIARYKAQMSGGVIFPPIVVTDDAWVVDGSTRIGATSKSQSYMAAYVLKIKYEEADEEEQTELIALGATLNQQSGTPLSRADRRASVIHLLKLNWLPKQIERAIGVPNSTINTIKEEEAARKRLIEAQVPMENGALKGVPLRAFSRAPAITLNHGSLRLLAKLAKDASLNQGEIITLAKGVVKAGGDAAAEKFLGEQRVELQERIKNQELTGRGLPPASGQLRQHLGFINKFSGRERLAVERTPALRYQHREAITTAIAVLQNIVELLDEEEERDGTR